MGHVESIRIIITEEKSYEDLVESLGTMWTKYRRNLKIRSVLQDLFTLSKLDKENFSRITKMVYGALEKDGNINSVDVSDLKVLIRRKRRANEINTVKSVTGKSFVGSYKEDWASIREFKRTLESKQREVEVAEQELEKTQVRSGLLAQSLAKGKKVVDSTIIDASVELGRLTDNYRTKRIDTEEFDEAYQIFLKLFKEKFKDLHDLQTERDEATSKETEDRVAAEGKNISQAGRRSAKIFTEAKKRAAREEKIKRTEFDSVSIKVILDACNDVAKMQLDVKDVFREVIKTGSLATRMFRYLNKIRGGEKKQFEKFYKDIALGFIEMIKNVVQNYPDASKIIDKEDLLNVLRSLENIFKKDLTKFIEGWKLGDLPRKAEEEWNKSQTIFHDKPLDRIKDYLKQLSIDHPNATSKEILEIVSKNKDETLKSGALAALTGGTSTPVVRAPRKVELIKKRDVKPRE